MANYYVAMHGSDTNSGSLLKPWRTIGEGLNNLGEGDCLNVLGGAYAENFVFTNTLRDNLAAWKASPKVVAYPSHNVSLISCEEPSVVLDIATALEVGLIVEDDIKSLAYYSSSGLVAVQDPANYAGVSLVKITCLEEGRPSVSALMYVVGGPDYMRAAPADLTRPEVTITFPDENNEDVFSETQEVTAIASDDTAVDSMWISLDGKPVASSHNTTTCTFSWNTTLSTNGEHSLEAFAKDTSGNVGVATSRVVTVGNHPSIAIEGEPSFGNVNIDLIRDGAVHRIWENIPNTGSVHWVVFGNRAPHCRIRIESVDEPSLVGLSEEFDIV